MSTAGPGPGGDALVHAVYLADVLAKAVGAGLDDNADSGPADLERSMARARASPPPTSTSSASLVGERLAEVERRFD